jgi:uncharacterized repeat protein (TIGR02543 family)
MRVNWDIKLTAKWTPHTNYYTVAFDSNGGSAVAAQTVAQGSLATKPTDPTRAGHTFAGWYYTRDGSTALFNFSETKANRDLTLTAKWTPSVDPTPDPVSPTVTPSAYVEKLNGNKNNLTITVTASYADGSSKVLGTKTFSINNNAADTYSVGGYNVYVDTKGNTQIRSCHIVR